MANAARIEIEIQFGPALQAAVDVLYAANDLIELIPEWHATEREALRFRMHDAAQRIRAEIKRHEKARAVTNR